MNLIITCAKGYTKADLDVFLNSLNNTSFEGTLIIITDSKDLLCDKLDYTFRYVPININSIINSEEKRLLNKRFFKKVALNRKLTNSLLTLFYFLKVKFGFDGFYKIYCRICHVYLLRFALFHNVLEQLDFKNVLITDCRDVFFKDNPFTEIKDESLFVFPENMEMKIKDEHFNSLWIKNLYGSLIYNDLKNQLIYNIGTVIGSKEKVLNLLELLLKESFKNNLSVVEDCQDQAIFNYLIHNNKINNCTKMLNGKIVFTVGTISSNDLNVNNNYLTYKDSHVTCSIIHQYDRHPILLNWINQMI